MTAPIRTLHRAGLIALVATLTLGLPASASATSGNCLVEVINDEKAFYGPAWGHDAVSMLARNPELFEGASNLGEVARFLARASAEDCPVFEGE